MPGVATMAVNVNTVAALAIAMNGEAWMTPIPVFDTSLDVTMQGEAFMYCNLQGGGPEPSLSGGESSDRTRERTAW